MTRTDESIAKQPPAALVLERGPRSRAAGRVCSRRMQAASAVVTKALAAVVMALCTAVFTSTLVAAQTGGDASELKASLAEIFERAYPEASEPGATVIVTRGDEVLLRSARGMADLELGVALEPDMVFRLGSITKQFTGVAIRLLELEGQLTLDDRLGKFLPDYPGSGADVTVEQLLAHTSGIKSYTSIPGYMDQEIRRDLEVAELIDVFDDLPADFAPGERYLYNNSGYVLLGAVIEQVTGQTYAEFLTERLFEPLGMHDTRYGDPIEIVPDRARGYAYRPDGWQNAPFLSMTQPYSAGSLLSTVDDLSTWHRALRDGKLMPKRDAEKLWTSFRTNDGEQIGYGYGFQIGDVRGHRAIQHGGGIHGFVTFATWLPEQDVYVAVLSNNQRRQPGAVALDLAAAAAGDPFPRRIAIELPEEILRRYVGVYRIDEEETRTVTFSDGKLHTQRTGGGRSEIRAETETRFFYDGSHSYLDFVLGDDGEVSHMLMYQNGATEAERADLTEEAIPVRTKIELSAEQAADYAGAYRMQPGIEMTIRVDGSRVFSQLPGQPEVELFADAKDSFFLEVVDAQVTFGRDDDGAVSTVTIHQGGRQMPGEKVE